MRLQLTKVTSIAPRQLKTPNTSAVPWKIGATPKKRSTRAPFMYSGACGPGTFETPTLNVGRLAPNNSWLDASALKPHDVSAPGKLALSSESCLAPPTARRWKVQRR
jgi:hypothetical protein